MTYGHIIKDADGSYSIGNKSIYASTVLNVVFANNEIEEHVVYENGKELYIGHVIKGVTFYKDIDGLYVKYEERSKLQVNWDNFIESYRGYTFEVVYKNHREVFLARPNQTNDTIKVFVKITQDSIVILGQTAKSFAIYENKTEAVLTLLKYQNTRMDTLPFENKLI
jgi:hypothetical protein